MDDIEGLRNYVYMNVTTLKGTSSKSKSVLGRLTTMIDAKDDAIHCGLQEIVKAHGKWR